MARQITLFQGCGSATEKKSLDIGGLLQMRMRQNQGKWVEFGGIKKFIIADLFCGDGYNIVDGTQIIGSPLRAIEAVQNTRLADKLDNITLLFSDVRADAISRLKREFKTHYLPSNVTPIFQQQQAKDMLDMLTDELHREKDFHCSLLLDPNGPAQLPLDELDRFSRLFADRSDIIINLNVTAYKRIWGHLNGKGKDSYDWWISHVRDLDQFVGVVGKYYKGEWMRENRPGLGGWSIFCCFGYSVPTFWAKAGFYPYQDVRDKWLTR